MRDDPSLIRQLDEVVLESPVHLLPHHDAREVEGWTTIPEARRSCCFLGAANRDHRKFPEPECFDIRRRLITPPPSALAVFIAVAGQLVARPADDPHRSAQARVDGSPNSPEPVRKLNNTLRCIGPLPVRLRGHATDGSPGQPRLRLGNRPTCLELNERFREFY